MESPSVERFISSLAQSVKPGCPEVISRLNLIECNEEIESLLKDGCDAQTASSGQLLRCLLLIFHRQTSLAVQSKTTLEQELELLRTHNSSLLNEVQMANKKAMRYLDDLHSAELDLCSHKEELLRLRSGCLSPPPLFSQCDSGYSDSHSSLDGRLTPSPLGGCEQFSTDPKSLGIKSVPQPPLRNRDKTNMTSPLPETDSEVTGSLSSRRYSTHYPQSLMHDTFIRAPPPERGTRSLQECPTSFLHLHERDNSCPAPASQLDRTAAWDVNVHRDASLEGPRFKELEYLARDIENFEPDNSGRHVEDYLSSLERCLTDLPRATQREKVNLVEKTSSKAVRNFIETQPPSVRDDYRELCHALKEEFSSSADETAGIVAAIQVKHSRREHPRDYYIRFRHAYFQGRNAPGLEENPIFKSLFVKNLHPCVRPHVEMSTRQENLSLKEIRKMTQLAWEAIVNFKSSGKTPEPAFSNTTASQKSPASKRHPPNRPKGGDKRMHRDTERNRHVHQLRRDRHADKRSCRRPYAEILAQNYDQPAYCSDDDHSFPDHSSVHSFLDSDSASEILSAPSYSERYSPEPQFKQNLNSKDNRFSFW